MDLQLRYGPMIAKRGVQRRNRQDWRKNRYPPGGRPGRLAVWRLRNGLRCDRQVWR
jgi:hypothetical protein